jgi:hypothetical protein
MRHAHEKGEGRGEKLTTGRRVARLATIAEAPESSIWAECDHE